MGAFDLQDYPTHPTRACIHTPAQGSASRFETKQWYYTPLDDLTLVFFCGTDSNWKIGDFGLTRPGTTVVAKTTLHGRGTAGYRAPEVLREDGRYTNKVDIFALGCILFELATKSQAFKGDWSIREYAISDSSTLLPVHYSRTIDDKVKNVIATIIHETLQPDPSSRPSAKGILNDIINPFVEKLEGSNIPNDDVPDDKENESEGLWRRLAEAHEKSREFQRARLIWKKLLDRSAADIVLQDRYAQTFHHLQDYEEEILAWIEMIKAHPEIHQLQTHLQRACEKQRERDEHKIKVKGYEQTIKYWEGLSEKDPSNKVLSLQLLKARKELGEFAAEVAHETKRYYLAIPIWESLVDSYPRDLTLRKKLLQMYRESCDYPNAIRLLKISIAEDPSNWVNKVQLANTYEENGEKELAIQTLREVVDSGHGDWSINHLMYLMYRRCQDFEGLVEWRKEQLSRCPDDEQLKFHLADAYHDNGDYDEAIAVLRQLTQKGRAKYQIALAYRGKEDHEAEIATFKSLLQDDPQSPEYRRGLAKAYQNGGNFSSAVELLKGYVNSFCCDCQYLTEAFELIGDDGAVKGWKEMMELHPTWSHLRNHLVEAYQKKKDHDSPCQLLEDLIEQDPENYDLQRELALAYAKADDPEQRALNGWMSLINRHPTCRGLHEQLSNYFDSIGNHSAAIEGWRTLVEKLPNISEFRDQLARAYDRSGDHRNEAFIRTEILNGSPSSINARYELHKALEKAGDPSLKIECWKRLVQYHTRHKERPYYRESDAFENYLQKAFLEAGEYDSAIKFWRMMMERYPGTNNALNNRLAEIYNAKGNMDEAIVVWIALLENSLGIDASATRGYLYQLKEAHAKKGDKGAATVDCSNLINIYSDDRDLNNYLSELFVEMGDIDMAVDVWTKLLHANPGSKELTMHLEEAYRKKGDNEAAILGWKSLRSKHPAYFQPELIRAMEYPTILKIEQSLKQARDCEKRGEFKKSSALWLDLVMQQPTRTDWISELSRNLRKLQDIDYAISSWTQILYKCDPRTLEDVISQLSLVYERKGDIDAEIQGWIDLIPRSPSQFIAKLGVAYRKKGDLDAEIDGWTALIAKYPGREYSILNSQLRFALAGRNQKVR